MWPQAENTPGCVFARRVVLLSKSPRWCYLSSVSVTFLFSFFSFFWNCWHLPVAPRRKLVSLALVESYCCPTWWVMSEMISTGNSPHLWIFQNDLGYECVVWLVYVCAPRSHSWSHDCIIGNTVCAEAGWYLQWSVWGGRMERREMSEFIPSSLSLPDSTFR